MEEFEMRYGAAEKADDIVRHKTLDTGEHDGRLRRQVCALRESLLDLLDMVDQRVGACTDVPLPESDRLRRAAAAAEHREFKISRVRAVIEDGREYDSDWNEAIKEAMRVIAKHPYGRMAVHQVRALKRLST